MTDAMMAERAAGGESTPPMLEVRDAAGGVTCKPLPAGKVILGRAPDAGLRLDHVMVSRQHAELFRQADGALVVRDLGSRNGTLVNGNAVSLRVLAPGDEITVGPFTVKILHPQPPAPPPVASADPVSATFTDLPVIDTSGGRITTLREVESPRVDANHLMRLNEFSRELLDTPDSSQRLTALCRLMAGGAFHGRWAVAIRVSKEDADSAVRVLGDAQRGTGESAGEPYISRSVLRAIRRKNEAVLASNSGSAVDLEVSMAAAVMQVAIVACPLADRGDSIDLLYVILPPEYGTGEWLAMSSLAAKQYQQAEAAWAARRQSEAHTALERELNAARKIQMKLVPRDPKAPGLDIAIGFVPCLAVGGDYVDAVRMSDGRVLLAVADVCGKGMAAALVASSVYTLMHSGVQAAMTFRPLMEHVNRYLCDTLTIGSFVTMFAAAIDPRTGAIEYANSGHPPALVLQPGQPARELKAGENLPLGCDPEPLNFHSTTLEPGELLALYSDGLTEMSDETGAMLGISGLAGALWAMYASPATRASEMAAALSAQLDAIQGGRPSQDDRTFLLVRREPSLAASDAGTAAIAIIDENPADRDVVLAES